MYFEIVSDALWGTSSDFGQLVVQRHFSSGIDCAIAGAATAVAAASPAPAAFRNSRRVSPLPPFDVCLELPKPRRFRTVPPDGPRNVVDDTRCWGSRERAVGVSCE